MIENANWFLFTMCTAEIERDELKRELLGLQMEFRRKLKGKNPAKRLQSKRWSQGKKQLRAVKLCLRVKIIT